MTAKPIPAISDAVAALLRRLLTEPPDDGARYSFPPGRGGSRVANKAADLGLVKQWDAAGKPALRGGHSLTPIVDVARAALRAYDQRRLPEGVTVTTDLTVKYNGEIIGELGRGGAGRGHTPRWSAVYSAGGAPTTLGSRSFGSHAEAARAVAKAHGLALPGEDPELPEAA